MATEIHVARGDAIIIESAVATLKVSLECITEIRHIEDDHVGKEDTRGHYVIIKCGTFCAPIYVSCNGNADAKRIITALRNAWYGYLGVELPAVEVDCPEPTTVQ